MKDLNSTQIKKSMDSKSSKMYPIILYVLENCPYCHSAMELLDNHKIKYNKIVVANDDTKTKDKYKKICNMNTFPMIFIQKSEDKSKYVKIGGFSDLQKYIQLIEHLNENNIDISIMKSLDDLL